MPVVHAECEWEIWATGSVYVSTIKMGGQKGFVDRFIHVQNGVLLSPGRGIYTGRGAVNWPAVVENSYKSGAAKLTCTVVGTTKTRAQCVN